MNTICEHKLQKQTTAKLFANTKSYAMTLLATSLLGILAEEAQCETPYDSPHTADLTVAINKVGNWEFPLCENYSTGSSRCQTLEFYKTAKAILCSKPSRPTCVEVSGLAGAIQNKCVTAVQVGGWIYGSSTDCWVEGLFMVHK
ncbi:uncharacterized protein K452DRAFT_295229 [Aplosporella prunicola CBS 121167]|uniref:Uncharacterized protein n=1 Tax=Aplosporella prunicola CBS 121167 TaxID=1176127 RepID=A0A6A6BSR4_9PEZI|nr:uncharacterized protein K452DRAFT_295229 [Aplosporella prunicola CBS 121167]KAF2145631.1 hypothetical protein K452DRAFT_295229 [Aplosporella prunicola CBS 121167]